MNKKKTIHRQPVFDVVLSIIVGAGAIIVLGLYWFVSPQAARFFGVVIFFLFLGFALPRWIGRRTRIARALAAKQKEKEKWGFHSRDREGPWINYVDFPIIQEADCAKGKFFYSEWLMIHDGLIIVNPGESTVDLNNQKVTYDYSKRRTYAWDGCTPKRFFYWIAIFGTPDWWEKIHQVKTLDKNNQIIEKSVFWQQAHHASLVHDALYQYLDTIPIAKKEVDDLLYKMLRESGMHPGIAGLYRLAVRFGTPDIKENDPKGNSPLTVCRVPTPSPTNRNSL